MNHSACFACIVLLSPMNVTLKSQLISCCYLLVSLYVKMVWPHRGVQFRCNEPTKSSKHFHICFRKLKIKDIKIFCNSAWISGFWDCCNSKLKLPSQQHLCWCFLKPIGQVTDMGVFSGRHDIGPGADAAVTNQSDPMLPTVLQVVVAVKVDLVALVVDAELILEHHGRKLAIVSGNQPVELLEVEVAHTHCSNHTLLVEFPQSNPGSIHPLQGLKVTPKVGV
mmetsp:Transcript_19986/g.25852  ORF Transcript_19986/g.25852 Transcript_19986/m.25852 type:complete len:223 (+) Transcript_19986:207-875(+)